MIELHEQAIKILKLIKSAKKRKDVLYRSYRQWCYFSSSGHLEKLNHNIEILDMSIDRLRLRYRNIKENIYGS